MTMKFKFCPKCAKPLSWKTTMDRSRQACTDEQCGFIFWNNPVPVIAIVAETPEGVVLAHNKAWPKDIFSIITGFLEQGETPEEAALRETKEELGLTGESITFIGVYTFYKMNQIILAYHVKGSGKIILNEELDAFKMVKKELLAGWNETRQFQVGEWLNKLSVLA
jgi:NAD+ diphosphatase